MRAPPMLQNPATAYPPALLVPMLAAQQQRLLHVLAPGHTPLLDRLGQHGWPRQAPPSSHVQLLGDLAVAGPDAPLLVYICPCRAP